MTTIVTLSGIPVAASSIINRAYRIVTQTREEPDATESAQALEALNGLLDAFRNESLMCYATQDETLTLVNGQISYTIGSGGDLNTNRPVRIDAAYVIYQTVSYKVTMFTDQQYAGINLKTQAGPYPICLYYAADMDVGHLWPWPICDNDDTELHVITWTPMISFASLTDSYNLPPGWYDALCFHLAIAMCPEYQSPVTPDLMKLATNAKKGIKMVNNATPVSTFDSTVLGPPYYDWRSAYP